MQASPISPIALNHYICPQNVKFVDFVGLAQKHGYKAIGISLRTLQELSAREIAAIVNAHGMQISSINSAGFFVEDGLLSSKHNDDNHTLLAAAIELNQGKLNIIPGNAGLSTCLASTRQRALIATREFVAKANDAGIKTVLEPFFPTGSTIKNCVNSIGQALEWLEEIPGLELNIDLLHTWWDPDLNLLTAGGYPLGLFQVCGISINHQNGMPSRTGLQGINFELAGFIYKLRMVYPDIYTEVELFAEQLSANEPNAIIEQSSKLLNREAYTK